MEKSMATKPAEPVTPPTVEEAKPAGALIPWKDRMKALVTQTREAEKPQGGFISLKGGRMTYADEILPGDKINAVIIDYRMENAFYDQKFDPKNLRSPVCFSITQPGGIMVPHKDSEQPQHPECEGCPRLEWASDLWGGKGKACKQSRRLHLIAADELLKGPEAIAKAQVVTMIPPATSTDNFSKLANQITGVMESAIFGAIVEISVKPHDKFLYQVHYKILEQITNEAVLEALLNKALKTAAREITYPPNDQEGKGDPRQQSSKY
jgi:hypothetical protein